jgi:hypothetical protein
VSEDFVANRWGRAILRWQAGDPEPVREMLKELPSIPDFAREFLDDLATGNPERITGARRLRTPSEERDLVDEVFMELDALGADGSREVAIANVAERMPGLLLRGPRANDPDAVLRAIVEAHESNGYTRELWARYMRPNPGS